MKIVPARSIGYCMGVRRAMDLAFRALSRERGGVWSCGPLIHNMPALKLLEAKGLALIEPGRPPGPGAAVIIRAHGLPPEDEARLRASGVKVIDATCPKVARVQRIVARKAREGFRVVIWGREGHPEVEGLLGYAAGRGVVASGPDEIAALPEGWEKVFLAAQTTQDRGAWEAAAAAAEERWPGRLESLNSICEATEERQKSVLALCREVQAVVVVGGRDSANTRRLHELAARSGIPAVSVEGPEDIPPGFTDGAAAVGVASGASTPIWQLRMVYQALESRGRDSERSLSSFGRRLMRALALSYIYRAAGAGAMGLAVAGAAGYGPTGLFFALFFYFALAVHLFNGFLDRDTSRFDDPDRAAFFAKYRGPLALAMGGSLLLSLQAAASLGPLVLLLTALQTALALLYAVPRPARFFKARGLSGWKDVPGGRALSSAAGKTILLSFPALLVDPPLVPRDPEGILRVLCGAGFLLVHLLVRNFLMDLREARGDRAFGQGNVALLLGRVRSARILSLALALWAALIPAVCAAGILRPEAMLFLISGPLWNALVLRRFLKDPGLGGYQFDLRLDGQFFLAGLLSLAWHRLALA